MRSTLLRSMFLLTLHVIAIFAIYTPAYAQAESVSVPKQEIYLHAFRSPSIGAEYRTGNMGFHTGLYTTILGRAKRSTEFIKMGVTYYFGERPGRRYEPFVGLSYVRGLNRDYSGKNGAFLETGVRYRLTGQFDARLGVGVLAAQGKPVKINPTIGLSYRLPLR